MKILQLFVLINILLRVRGLDVDTAKMVVDYFSYKNVKQICSITCVNNIWLRNLTLLASDAGISVCAVNPLKSWLFIEKCLQQYLIAVGIILDIDCDGASVILERSSQERYFDAMHNWIILEKIPTGQSFLAPIVNDNYNKSNELSIISEAYFPSSGFRLISVNILEGLNISIDAEITISINSGINGDYNLYDVFNFGKIQGGTPIITLLGKWTRKHGLIIWLTDFKYQSRWDFKNITLRAISVMLVKAKVFSSVMLTGREFTPGVSAMTKISSMILDLFREKHNFRFNYTIVDRWVGAPDRNSSLAITNSMLWQEQDISSTCLRIFPAWLNWMDAFFPPTTYLETKFYYRIPMEGVGKLENKFLRPFSVGVWACVICAGALCVIALALAARVQNRPKATQFALFSVVAAFCQQMFEEGSDHPLTTATSSQSGRTALLVTGLCSLLLYNYYTSSVVSWLLSAPPPSIASLDELISSSLEVVFEDIGYTRSWLEVPGYYYGRYRSPKENILREKKVKSAHRSKSVLQSLDEGIELVRSGGYAYHTEPYNANRRIGRTFDKEELCDLGSLQMMERAPVYIVGQRRSPYREFFVWSMIRALERGHVSCARQRVSVPEPECAGSTPRALALGGAAPAFVLLATCGWGAALLLLLLEIVVHRRTHRTITPTIKRKVVRDK